jgi:hypothetical protein
MWDERLGKAATGIGSDGAFRKLSGFIKLMTIEVYGRPSDKAMKQLRQKAQMLGEGESVVVQQPQAGFARFPTPLLSRFRADAALRLRSWGCEHEVWQRS